MHKGVWSYRHTHDVLLVILILNIWVRGFSSILSSGKNTIFFFFFFLLFFNTYRGVAI